MECDVWLIIVIYVYQMKKEKNFNDQALDIIQISPKGSIYKDYTSTLVRKLV